MSKANKAGIVDAYPLSQMQSGMYYHYSTEQDDLLYHDVFSIHLATPWQQDAFVQAIHTLLDAHPVLRTSFEFEKFSQPLQLVHEKGECRFSYIDPQLSAESELDEFIKAQMSALLEQNFNLGQKSQIRFTVIKRNRQEFQLLVDAHHMILDGWSMATLLTELFQYYLANLGLIPAIAQKAPSSTSFKAFVRAEMKDVASGEATEFWREYLANHTYRPFSLGREKGPAKRHNLRSSLSKFSHQLQALAQSQKATLADVLLAAHLRVSAFIEGRQTATSTISTNGRLEVAGGDQVAGLFVNVAPICVDMAQQSANQLIQQVKTEQQKLIRHRRYPFAEIAREQGTPVSDLHFNYVHFHVYEGIQGLDGFQVVKGEIVEKNNFTISSTFHRGINGELELLLNYNGAVLYPEDAEDIAGYYHQALQMMLADPDAPFANRTLLTQAQLKPLLEWQNSTPRHEADLCLHHLFEAQAAKYPDATALVFEQNALSYNQLNQKANQLARELQSRGVKPDSLVGLYCERSLDMVVGVLGILKAGGAYVPMDPSNPTSRTHYMLKDAGIDLIVTQKHLSNRFDDVCEKPMQCISLDDPEHQAMLAKHDNSNLPKTEDSVRPNNISYVIYTSGSTGKPKGVVVEHRNVIRLFDGSAEHYDFRQSDCWSLFHSIAFDVSVYEIWGAFMHGAKLVVVPYDTSRSPAEFNRLLEREQVTVLSQTPSAFYPLSEYRLALTGDERLDTTSLRYVIFAGEALDPQLLKPWMGRYGDQQPAMINMYGITETTVHSTFRHILLKDAQQSASVVGKPLNHLIGYVCDHAMGLQPVGAPGELYLGGDGVTREYLNREDLTAQRFIDNPFSDTPKRLYKSGDLVRRTHSGELEYLTRVDHQAKLRGFRIELGEIEHALIATGLLKGAVVLLRGEGANQYLAGFVVPNQADIGHDELVEQLREALKDSLPEYMVPSAFALMDTLPLTGNGKVDKRALPETQWQSRVEFIAPSTDSEKALAEIWQQLLSQEQVGLADNFYELGGHSLLTVQLGSAIKKHFNIDLSVRELFDNATLASQAELIDNKEQTTDLPTLVRVDRNAGPLPLSGAQRRMWFIDQLEGDANHYNMPIALSLTGNIDKSALQQVLNQMIERHEILRTVYRNEPNAEGGVCQIIRDDVAINIDNIDLSQLPEQSQNQAVAKHVQQEAQKPFDLANDLMLRCALVKCSEQKHVLLITVHHIANDGLSSVILSQEFISLYRAFSEGKANPLPPMQAQYCDFAAWQNDFLAGDNVTKQINYWQKQLADLPQLHDLPLDKARPKVKGIKGASYRFAIDKSVAQGLNALAREHQATLFMVMHGAFSTLLSRHSNQSDIVVGTPVANRKLTEFASMVGLFVNTLVLRSEVDLSQSFNEHLAKIKDINLDAQQHQDVPFETLVDLLNPVRSSSHDPLFQVMLQMNNNPDNTLALPGLSISNVDAEHTIAITDLVLNIEDQQNGLSLNVEYNTDLFESVTIIRMAEQLQTLLADIVKQPNQSLAKLSVLPEQQKHYLLNELNDTYVERKSDLTVHGLFEGFAASTPDAIAAEHLGEQYSYAELNAKANRLADLLSRQGVKPGQSVAVYLPRSLDVLTSLLAVMKVGAAYVPLDTTYPIERLNHIVKQSQSVLVLSSQSIQQTVNHDNLLFIDNAQVQQQLSQCCDANPAVKVAGQSIATIYFTSGSTGLPKGAMNNHQGLVNQMLSVKDQLALTAADRVLQFAPLGFDVVVEEVFPAWFAGAAVVLRDEEGVLSGNEFQSMLTRNRISVVELMSVYWSEWVDYLVTNKLTPPNDLRQVLLGGDAVSMPVYRQWLSFNIPAMIVFGLTETGCTSFVYHATGEQLSEQMPNGRALANTRLYLLDQHQQPVPQGVIGELYIGGCGVGPGYIGQDDLTAERYLDDPFTANGEKLYKTGDLARYLRDGNILFIGRMDHQVKIRGARIELSEISAQLNRLPAIVNSYVDVQGKGAGQYIVAYIVSDQAKDEAVLIENTRQALQAHLPEYMIPSIFVVLEQLPLTATGKVDKRALPQTQWQAQAEYVAPVTDSEKALAKIWCKLLGQEQVGNADNFFELGGHSLLTVQLVSGIKQQFSIDVTVRDLFDHATLANQAALIDSKEQSIAYPPMVKVARDSGALALSPAQQRMWFIDQLEGDANHYNMPIALELNGELNLTALQQVLDQMIERHEILRTIYIGQEEGVSQLILENISVNINNTDLSFLSGQAQHDAVRAEVQSEAEKPFDLANDLMLRCSLVKCTEQKHVLLITVHHIANDGLSSVILCDEFITLYRAFSRQQANPLAPLEAQYCDFAAWQNDFLASEAVANQLDYWQKQLADLPQLHDLPLDKPRPKVKGILGSSYRFDLDAAVAQGLDDLAREHQATLFMVMHGAFSLLLSRHSNQSDIVIGTPVANRRLPELAPMVGLFVNTLVLRSEVDLNLSFNDYLANIKDINLDAQQNQDVPFETLVEQLNPVRSTSHDPLFQVMLQLDNATDADSALTLPGLTVTNVDAEQTIAITDLVLNIHTNESGLSLNFEYSTDLFEHETITRMAEQLQTLLADIAKQPNQTMAELALLPESQKHYLLQTLNDTDLKRDTDLTIHGLVEGFAQSTPTAIAAEHKGEVLSYAELNAKANRLADLLSKQGVKAGQNVAVYLPRSLDVLASMLAVMKVGAAYVPMDPSYPVERLNHIVKQSQAAMVITYQSMPEHISHDVLLHIDSEAVNTQLAQCSEANPAVKVSSDTTATIYFTSGSTGLPKGAMNNHQGLVNQMMSMKEQLNMTAKDRLLQFAPIGFDVVVEEVFPAWFAGATVVLRDEEGVLSGNEFQALLTRNRITVCELMSVYWSEWVDYLITSQLTPPSDLRLLMIGGDAISMPVYRQWQSFNLPIVVVFGLTETGCTSFVYHADGEQPFEHMPNGRALANTRLYLLDQHQQPVPQGVIGELYIGGCGVGTGYIGQDDLTAERYVTDPFTAGSTLYRTGDLARYLPDGNILFMGRKDHQVKIRGARIELNEIATQLDLVAGVLGSFVDVQGEGENQYIIAYLVAGDINTEEAQAQLVREVQLALRQHLPEYMIPGNFVVLEQLPLTANGKVDKKALPVPPRQIGQTYVAPNTDTERAMIDIWQTLLGLDGQDNAVGIMANFFDIGGNSILATRLVTRINSEFEVQLPLRDIFEMETLEALAEHIDYQMARQQSQADLASPEADDGAEVEEMQW